MLLSVSLLPGGTGVGVRGAGCLGAGMDVLEASVLALWELVVSEAAHPGCCSEWPSARLAGARAVLGGAMGTLPYEGGHRGRAGVPERTAPCLSRSLAQPSALP